MMTKAFDPIYPGTAVARMNAARERARSLTDTQLNGDWVAVRRALLWAAGLRDDTTTVLSRHIQTAGFAAMASI